MTYVRTGHIRLLLIFRQPTVKSHFSYKTENTVRVYVNTIWLMLWREVVCVAWDLHKTRTQCLQKKKLYGFVIMVLHTVTTGFRVVYKTL
jgi:hypothetical protein